MRPVKLASTLTALLVVIAVATVLITPDPTDDVHGVFRSDKTLAAAVVAVVSASLYSQLSTDNENFGPLPELSTLNLLKLLCTCRC
jgi:hypothetical protein